MILTLRSRDLILRDHPVPLPRDPTVRADNHAEAERQRKAKEDERKKRQ